MKNRLGSIQNLLVVLVALVLNACGDLTATPSSLNSAGVPATAVIPVTKTIYTLTPAISPATATATSGVVASDTNQTTAKPSSFDYLESLSFIDPLHGWALGHGCDAKDCSGFLLRATEDGGKTWQPRPVPSFDTSKLPVDMANPVARVQFSTLKDGWIYGPGLFVTHDGGHSWQNVHLEGVIENLSPTPDSVWAVQHTCQTLENCTYHLINSGDGGQTWQRLAAQPPLPNFSSGVTLTRVNDKIAWWQATLQKTGTPERYSVFVLTQDGGKSWQTVTNPCGQRTFGPIAAQDAQRAELLCLGVGATDMVPKTLYATEDGAHHWTMIANTEPSGKNAGNMPLVGMPLEMSFPTPKRGYIVYARNSLTSTSDGGLTWDSPLDDQTKAEANAYSQRNLIFTGEKYGWFISKRNIMFRTVDGGIHWEQIAIE